MNVYPLFSSVVFANILNYDTEEDFEKLKKEKFFDVNNGHDISKSFSSVSKNVLKNFPSLKKNILNEFYNFKDNILQLTTTDFDISTSWMTKTLTGGYCQFHSHKNCYYSGVLYFDTYSTGDLVFKRLSTMGSIKTNDPKEWNIYNYDNFFIKPQKNLIVFFPNYLEHKINLYSNNENRFSLAFNFFPCGKIGSGDSAVNIKLI